AYSARDSRGNPGLLTVFRSEMLFIPPPPQTGAAVAGQPVQSVFAGQQSQGASQQQQATERFMEVYDRVRTFNVRYLAVDHTANTREWRDAWDDPQHYPEAIEITLEIVPDPKAAAQAQDDRGRKLYHTIISIPVTAPTPPAQQQPGAPAAL